MNVRSWGGLGRLPRVALLAALLAVPPFVVYANNYHHEFVLDDGYTIVGNTSLQSLRTIPRYFVDPSTYTTIREQADYRPVLQTTFALNYAMGGYDTWWWHFTQILLHVIVTIGVFALARRMLVLLGDDTPDTIALAAGLLFAVHPANSGVVNYLNARSSLLTAAFLLPALLAYLRIAAASDTRRRWAATILFTLALFTKVEAVGALGAFWAYELWLRARETPDIPLGRAIRASLDRRTWTRLAPMLAVTLVYFVVRARVMAPFPFADSRHAPDVGAYEYFLTQLTAWWYYVAHMLAPVRYVADDLAYPVYRTWREPVVLIAAAAWGVAITLLVSSWKRAPYALFAVVAAFALLSPTSSIAPLAEMVNEHRPYLPMAILSVGVIVPAGRALRRWPRGHARHVLAAFAFLILVGLGATTWKRNEVFATNKAYWADVLSKAPSARAHLNYGLALMRENDIAGALRQYDTALELGPRWYFTHINRSIAFQRLGQLDSARTSLDRAVEYDRFSGLALTWRGEFRLSQRDYQAALEDFAQSDRVGLQRYRNARGLATASAGLGDAASAMRHTERMLAMDSAGALADVAAIATPFFADANLRPAGIRYYQALDARVPGQPWIAENIRRLAAPIPATVTLAGSRQPTPLSQEQLMSLGLQALRDGNPSGAESRFRDVLALNPNHYGAHYQLAVALDRLHRPREARVVWQRVLRMAEGYGDQATIVTARERLSRKD